MSPSTIPTHPPTPTDPHKHVILDGILALHVNAMKRLDAERHFLLVHISKDSRSESEYLLKCAALNRNYQNQREAQSREYTTYVQATLEYHVAPQE